MNRRDDYSQADAAADAREEKERMEKLIEKGLCLQCEDRPQNTGLSGNICYSCFEGIRGVGCSHTGCPNKTVGSFRQGSYCKPHLVDRIHNAYDAYLTQKSHVVDKDAQLMHRLKHLEEDQRDINVNGQALTEAQTDWYEDWIDLKVDKRDMHETKHMVERAIEQVDSAFPEGYEVFG